MKAGSLNAHIARRLLLLIGICIVIVVLSTPKISHAATTDDESGAYIRIIHASPDIGIVDVFVDEKKLLSNFQFATVTDYIPIPAGSHKVQLALIGKGINAAIVTQSLEVKSGTSYTVATLGVKQSGFSFTVFADNNSIVDNGTKLRVYHLSPGTGTSEVQTPEQTIVNAISYQQASTYTTLASGTYDFKLSADTGKEILSSTVTLKPWTVTSIFVIGVAQGQPKLQLVTSEQQGLPGMPQTGSDPTVRTTTPPSWMFALLALLMVCVGAGGWRMRSLATAKIQKNPQDLRTAPTAEYMKKG
ncbi:cell wall anchor [Dictyobacter alpinus]|uniref:Cell wall anchor n=1 Tax=Dictyobacter alpinus TaxID=2014873 RepID=A0A402BFL9_9CHLR|nr:DUF4397 domain-containing protein [Dictyobacter alpinus]GCE30185.1 cell wall anchor [Dictyobacter alpinus]